MGKDYAINIAAKDNISSVISGIRKEFDGMRSRVDKLKKSSEAFDVISKSGISTRQKIKLLKEEMGRLALQGLDNEAVFKKFGAECKRLQASLNKVRDATKSAAKAAKQNSTGLSTMMGAGTAAAGVLGLLGGVGSEAATKILLLQSTVNSLQGSMKALEGTKYAAALSNPFVLAGAAATAAGVAWFNYNKEVEATMRRTQQFTGLTGGELLSLRNGIKSVASTWDKDYNDVLSTVDSLMAQYGIDGETALNIVRDGFVSGADEAGRMQEMISKYAGSFNDAGISASELVAIIGNTRSGIFSEEGMAVIQMGAKNIRDMSTAARESLAAVGINADEMTAKLNSGQMTTMEAIQQISARLKTLPPQSAQVGAVLQDVFGKKGAAAGYQLVTALADVESNLDTMKKQTGEVGEATERLQEAHRRLEDAMSMVFMSSEGGFETMATTIKAEVLEALADLIKAFAEVYNSNILLRGAVASIGMVFKNIWVVIKSVLKLMLTALTSLAKVVEGIFTLDWDKIKEGWSTGVKSLVETLGKGVEQAAQNLRTAVESTQKKMIIPVAAAPKDPGPSPVVVGDDETGNGNGGTGNGGTGNKSGAQKRQAEAGSIADLQAKIKALDDELQNSARLSTARVAQIKAERMELERQIQTLKNLQREMPDNLGGPIEASKPQAMTTSSTPALDQLQTKTGAGLVGNAIMDGMQGQLDEQYQAFRAHWEKIKGIIDGMRGDTDAGVLAFVNLGDVMRDSMASASDKAATALGTVGASLQQLGADGPIAKVGAVMAAVGQAVLGFATASAQAGAQTGPWGWLAFVGAGLGTLAAMVSTIKGFNVGGIVDGNSFHGDRMLARVNAGEMILTKPQQGRLFDILDGGGGPMGGGGTVRFEIAGDKLYGVLDNYNRKMRKVR